MSCRIPNLCLDSLTIDSGGTGREVADNRRCRIRVELVPGEPRDHREIRQVSTWPSRKRHCLGIDIQFLWRASESEGQITVVTKATYLLPTPSHRLGQSWKCERLGADDRRTYLEEIVIAVPSTSHGG